MGVCSDAASLPAEGAAGGGGGGNAALPVDACDGDGAAPPPPPGGAGKRPPGGGGGGVKRGFGGGGKDIGAKRMDWFRIDEREREISRKKREAMRRLVKGKPTKCLVARSLDRSVRERGRDPSVRFASPAQSQPG